MRAFLRLYKGRPMITIQNFNDAYQLYQLGLITFRLLQEQAVVMLSLCGKPTDVLSITNQDIHWLLQQAESTMSYMNMLGGDMHTCEQANDLKQIKGCDDAWAETHNGNWPNVTDMPLTWDVCCYLDEVKGEPQWAMFLLCWNNSGGPVYYVPEHLWDAARVTEHLT